MRYRLAKKICKRMLTDPGHYPPHMEHAAVERTGRTRSERKAELVWCGIMDFLGVEGRAKVVAGLGNLLGALNMLVRTPEDQWAGNPSAYPF